MRVIRLKTIQTLAIVLLTIFMFCCNTKAANFCVVTSAEMTNALTTAASNSQNDTIHIIQGTYEGVFAYNSTEPYSLDLEGGYTAACADRQVDSANTILDAKLLGRTLTLSSSVAANLKVDGLTMTNGEVAGDFGGGLYVSSGGGALTVNRSTIRDNSADDAGGIFISGPDLVTVTDNTISQNHAPAFHSIGGGILITNAGTVTLTGNTINDNELGVEHFRGDGGGGVFIGGLDFDNGVNSATLKNNTITGNISGDGGGVYVGSEGFRQAAGSVVIASNTISGNTATGDTGSSGGGICIMGSFDPAADTVTISGNIIKENTASGVNTSGGGGGIFAGGTHDVGTDTITLTNNLITANKARTGDGLEGEGGGILIHGDGAHTVNLVNNTISGNEAADNGGGIHIVQYENSDRADIYNNIIWGNTAAAGADIYLNNDGNSDASQSIVNLFNNDFDQTATTGTYFEISFLIDASNLDNEDPLFIDATNDDYHLTEISPCVDTGKSQGAPNVDIENTVRPINGGYDMGAYEFVNIFFISSGFECNGNTPCYASINSGISAAAPNKSTYLKIRQETFTGDININESKTIKFWGGWNSTFTVCSAITTVDGKMMFTSGSAIMENMACQ